VIGNESRQSNVVRDDDHRPAKLLMTRKQQLSQERRTYGIEPRVGLVTDENVGLEHEGPCQSRALPHAS